MRPLGFGMVLVFVIAVIVGTTALATAGGRSVGSSSGGACGVERWAVKTLQDRPRLLANRRVTVRYLDNRPAPESLPSTRLPFERHVFTVIASVTFLRE